MKWQSTWIRGGKIEEVAWVDHDIIAWYSGVHIVFFHLINGEEEIFSCSQCSDGASCISGHPILRLIAFAEKSRSPRILVYSYPSMTQISECCGGSESGYLAIAFASSEYLVSLASCPTYSIIIWNWKNGNELFSIPSPIHNRHGQMIRVSSSQPMYITQLGRDSGQLIVWTVTTTSTFVMSHVTIKLPHEATAIYCDWSSHEHDPQLVIVDEHGHVYISDKDGSAINCVVFSQRCGVCLEYEMPIVCWFHDGIVLKTTFCQIRYYKKNRENNWRRERYIEFELKPYIVTANPLKNDQLCYFTKEGFLMQMSLSVSGEAMLKCDKKFRCGTIYIFIDFIYPWAHDLVIIDTNFHLSIIEVTTGKFIGGLNMHLKGEVTHLVSHPDYPLVALITTNGELFLITVYKRDNPYVLFKYRLQTGILDILKFSQCGKHLIVGEKTSGICYCITSVLNHQYCNIYQLQVKRQIIDAVVYDDNGIIEVMVLIFSSPVAFVGNYMFIYELSRNTGEFIQAKFITHLPSYYQYIHYAPGSSKVLVASPYLSRQIHFLKRVSQLRLNLINSTITDHNIRGLKIHTNRRYITTSGIDGVVTVFTGQTHTPSILLTHHRKDLGVSKAICSPTGTLVIALGRDGSIVCVELRESEKIVRSDYVNLNESTFAFLSGQCQIIPSETQRALTWTDWKQKEIFMEEETVCRVKRLAIIKSFNEIKTKIQMMLDENERYKEIERLPVTAFDLAIFTREQKMKLAREKREDVRVQLEFECSAMNKVINWITTTFCKSQGLMSKSIFSIFADVEVTNYPSVVEDPQEKEMVAWCEYFMDSNIKVKYISSEFRRCSFIKHRYRPSSLDEELVMESLLINDEEYEDEEEKRKERQAYEGITTYKFIEPSSQYSQFQDYTFSQFLAITSNIFNDIQQLKNYFNKLFDKMYEVKEEEVALFHQRNEQIHHIDLELKLLFNQSVPEILSSPEWHCREHPEFIINVLDDEIMAKLYVPCTLQGLENTRVEQAKSNKQILMSDDFYDKTLLAIMDGVLEVRWEDVIKREISKPQCMLIKSPDQYDMGDILAVKKYEINLETLTQEREKYRRFLETDFSKIMKILKEDVGKFDSSLRELLLMKMKVESAIQQLNLLRARTYLRASYRMKKLYDISSCQQKIAYNKYRIQEILDENDILQALMPDLRSQRQELLANEKTMLGKFKTEFSSLGKMTIDILRKQYKRRPKLALKHTTASDLLELGRCIITNNISKYLNHYCVEYLTHLDAIDVQPLSLFESIKSDHWFHLVKIRRNKIELEMKLKSNWREMNEIDRGIADNNKKIEKLKAYIFELEDELNKMDTDQQEFDLSSEIQLVLTLGQVEISLSGHKEETKHSILLSSEEITRINKKILQIADEKLDAMATTIKFSRGRLLEEWQHKCQKMTIADVQDHLYEIKNFTITKDIRVFLMRRAMGLKEDKTLEQLEKQVEAMKITLHKSLENWVMKLEGIEAKIENFKRDNDAMDGAITRMNVQKWEMELTRDLRVEDRCKEFNKRKMELVLRRSKLINQIQERYVENLALQTEYELLQLKKCPAAVSFEILGDDCNKKITLCHER